MKTHPQKLLSWIILAFTILNINVVMATPVQAPYNTIVSQPSSGPYFTAPFVVKKNSFTFPQSPSWSSDGGILFSKKDQNGVLQIYKSKLDGSNNHCLTAEHKGPNGFPQQRPQGDWILFESYRDQPQHFGSPGLGGYGGDLYVMRPDGSEQVRLTLESDPNNGVDYSKKDGVPYDNFHAYWSPDGHHIIWTRVSSYPLKQGGARWEMLLADFVASERGRCHLENIRVVGPAYGVYETQPWSPDGSGFLFSSMGGRNSPFQSSPPGWGQQNVYFMRLFGDGASPEHPRVTKITSDISQYVEQAIFTPDMKQVIFMASMPASDSWYTEVAAAASRTAFDAPLPGSTLTMHFLASFATPPFHTDLWMSDIQSGALRRLTNFNGCIPEFFWNQDYSQILWSQVDPGGTPSNHSTSTYIGSFQGITDEQRKPRTGGTVDKLLYGEPIEMSRVNENASIKGSASVNVFDLIKAIPVATKGMKALKSKEDNKETLPMVAVSYYLLWQKQLEELGKKAQIDIQNRDFILHAAGLSF